MKSRRNRMIDLAPLIHVQPENNKRNKEAPATPNLNSYRGNFESK